MIVCECACVCVQTFQNKFPEKAGGYSHSLPPLVYFSLYNINKEIYDITFFYINIPLIPLITTVQSSYNVVSGHHCPSISFSLSLSLFLSLSLYLSLSLVASMDLAGSASQE